MKQTIIGVSIGVLLFASSLMGARADVPVVTSSNPLSAQGVGGASPGSFTSTGAFTLCWGLTDLEAVPGTLGPYVAFYLVPVLAPTGKDNNVLVADSLVNAKDHGCKVETLTPGRWSVRVIATDWTAWYFNITPAGSTAGFKPDTTTKPSPPAGCVSFSGGSCVTPCNDGEWSSSTGSGTCSNHGGEA